VRKSFAGREVLRGMSFSVGRGEVFGILGPNGAGKTTLIRIIAGLLKPDAGEVRLNLPRREAVGYLPEERGVYRRARVADFLRYLGELRGMDAKEAERRALHLLERMGMLSHARRRLEELSKGMVQKVQMAGVLIHSPEVLLLDEPFSGLDPVNTREMERLIEEQRDAGAAVILSTHMIERAERLCERIVMIHRGMAVLQGMPEEICRAHYGGRIRLEVHGELPEIEGARVVGRRGGEVVLEVEGGTAPADVLRQLMSAGAELRRFEAGAGSLREVFVRMVEENEGRAGGC